MAVQDLIVLVLIMFVVGFTIFLAKYLVDFALNPVSDKLSSDRAKEVLYNVELVTGVMDQAFVFISIGGAIAILIWAYYIKSSPVFFFLSLFILAIVILIVPPIANVFQDISETDRFSTYTSDYPFMMILFNNLPTFIFFIGFILSVVLYAKWRRVDEI